MRALPELAVSMQGEWDKYYNQIKDSLPKIWYWCVFLVIFPSLFFVWGQSAKVNYKCCDMGLLLSFWETDHVVLLL